MGFINSQPIRSRSSLREKTFAAKLPVRFGEVVGASSRSLMLWIRLLSRSSRFSLLLNRSEEHTSELQSRENLVCRLLLEKKKKKIKQKAHTAELTNIHNSQPDRT